MSLERLSFGHTLEEMKRDFAEGRERLRDDEYLGDDGLPYCKKCKTARYFSHDGGKFACRCLCKCQEEEAKRQREIAEHRKRMDEFNKRKKLSLLGKRYQNLMFSNATITDSNREAYAKCKNYVAKSKEVIEHNIGLYIYGDNSSGKTFLTACMCNELVWRGYRCIYTNLASILNEIRSSYDGNGMGECALLLNLRSYDFAFIDDIGKEFLGREYSAGSAKWAEEKLFEVINERYNAQKPTVFSSNYSIGELHETLNLDKAIVERINEMATRVIKLEGDDFRKAGREAKSEIAKGLGI